MGKLRHGMLLPELEATMRAEGGTFEKMEDLGCPATARYYRFGDELLRVDGSSSFLWEGETYDEDHLVFDFLSLGSALSAILEELEHRMLVPLLSPHFRIEHDEKEVELSYEGKRWVFPRADCALLPVESTTAELLARWIADRLGQEIARRTEKQPGRLASPHAVRIEVEESPGQAAFYERRVHPNT